jgi:hypothetical protein
MAEVLSRSDGQRFPAGIRRTKSAQSALFLAASQSRDTRSWREELHEDRSTLRRSSTEPLDSRGPRRSRRRSSGRVERPAEKTRYQPAPGDEPEPVARSIKVKINHEESRAPPSSPLDSQSSSEASSPTLTTSAPIFSFLFKAEDDTAARPTPSLQVDYLSHNWREEDIWSSWRHVVSQRKTYGEVSRLENASWRTWAKHKDNLRTIAPQKLNWYFLPLVADWAHKFRMKDCDVTWLYGPLQRSSSYTASQQTSEPQSNLSKSNSFLNKKPILKKRSMSELMLQKSLSASSLVRQAAAAVQAQQALRPRGIISRRQSDYSTDMSSCRTMSRDMADYFSSQSTSGLQSPLDQTERKHIRFDNNVEQCIAVEIKDTDFEDEDDLAIHDSSDEGLLMMKKRRKPRRARPPPRRSSDSESKIIAKLPSTTLKDRADAPRAPDSPSHSLLSSAPWNPGKLSPSPSVETLRPSAPSRKFVVEDEAEDDDDEFDPLWNPEDPYAQMVSDKLHDADVADGHGAESDEKQVGGLRRTPSGMLMPYEGGGEDGDDEAAFGGIVGRVLDTVNTARDIAHVIWNVGFRR